ncbi:RNF31-like protein [Mya arenaria]|uniref:RNF31-like protein n=1 Tax=Mya arenaria TaxID=6604 RepID=A0ABY7EU62_MYAAR|nr:RNF31-like protein [Mya arenaria]
MEEMDEFRQQLAAAIFDGSETKGPMIQILYAETPFRQKFRCVDFGTLLRNNSQGAREILQKMGYTETRLDGVAFPEGAEPDHSQVLNVVLDLMIGRKELEHYLENQHPQPSSLEDCLAPGFRQLLEGGDHLQVAGETGIPQPLTGLEVQSSTGSASHQEAHGPAHKQPVIMESQPVGIPNSSPAQALQSQYRQEMEEQPREPQSMQVGTGHQRLDVMNTGAQSMTPGYGGLQLQGVGYNGMGNQMPGQSRFTPGQPASSLALQRNFPQQYNPSVTAQQAWLRQQQQIASQLDPSFHNQPLQGSQSTREPHDEPSNLPALPGHSPVWQTPGVQQLQTQQHAQEYQGARPKYSPVPDKQADDISSPEENKAGSLVCEICGKHTADVLCQMCGSKQLCRECDFKWHSHPKRQNHSLEMLRRPSVQSGVPVSVKPGDPEGAGLGHRAPLGSEETVPVVLRRPPDQQASGEPQRISGYGFPQHQAHDNYMSQQRLTQQRLSTPETPEKMPHYPSNMQYNPTFHAQQHGNMVGHSSNGSNMSGGYVYGSQQPPMVSYMGYPAGMVQQPGHMGQQFFYAPMYPMQSGLPSHMSIQGSYVGPQGSGVGEMGMQHSQSESAISRSPSVGPLPQRSISEKPQHMKHSTSSPKTLTRRKRKHLQEITELDKYKTELEREIHELEEQRGKEDEARMLRDRFQQIQGKQAGHAQNTTVSDNSQQGYPLYADFQPQGPPGSSRQPPYGIIPPNVPQVSSSYVMVSTVHQSVMSSAPGHIVTSSGPYHSAYNPQKYGNPEESPPALAIESMNDGNIEEIKRMLVLDQNPHAPRTNIAMVPAQEQRAEQVAFPPSIEEIESKVSQGQVRKSGVQEGLGADMEGARWQCDHCTYLNELSEKVCGVCYRTSDQKKIVYQSGGAEVPVLDQPSVQKASEEMERCEHCTVDNPRGTKVCQVCNRSQDKYQKLEPILTLQQQQQQVLQQQQQILIQQQKQQKPHQQCKVKPQMSGEGEQPMSPYEIVDSSFKGEPASPGQPNVGKLINDEQDRIYFEKKKAQEDYERKQREEMSASMSRMNIREPETRAGCQERGRYPGVSGAAVTGGAGNAKMNISGEERIPENLTRIRQKSDQDKSSDHSSDEIYTSAPSSLDPTLDQADPHQTGRVDSPRMQEPGGRVHEGRGKKPDLNFEEAIQKINQRKEQEQMYQDGKELLLLIRLCGTQGLQPLEWLHDVWPSLAELVANTATANGKKAPQNDVGDVSTQEARSALLKSAGEIEKAVKQCVEDRKQKYAEVSASGEFAREDVLTALYQHSGDVEEVVDQLNQALRRIRMVFVEGKLRSWGRAETVVRILDEDVAGNEGSLQCTLDDIIEAVRNCGDRRSSLIFLKQECGICFSYYPMSKKHVRNWCCPLCDLPGLEDEESASEYFEFLALLLNNMVCKEVMMVFDIKLRDWHLQKDPNFRWCAHCVTGFIWDQPDRLEMTCVSCRKKTCFLCKRKWERAHEGLTCEQFTQWKIDNDPDKQAKGVQLYLEENGIDALQPSEGWMYAFHVSPQCKQLRSCGGKGLHCHHPRNCYYYLRDYEPSELQKLLKNHEVVYNTESQATGPDQKHCQVMEQKEYGRDKKDEACGKDTEEGTAGLCMGHYKEYLVGLINKHGIDPLETMTVDQMKVLIERMEKQMPPLGKNEAVDRYRRRVEKFIKDSWKLPGRP